MADFIFVFGSNLAGRHGMGAAYTARKEWGAEYGVGVGPTGRAYAIPTKNEKLQTLKLSEIKPHVEKFIDFAKQNPQLVFYVTRIGCGLADYKEKQIRPLFDDYITKVGNADNIIFTWEDFTDD